MVCFSRAAEEVKVFGLEFSILVCCNQCCRVDDLGNMETCSEDVNIQHVVPVLSVRFFSHFVSAMIINFYVYRFLLYLSLFGFTMEPRPHRDRFNPPKRFLQHVDMSNRVGVETELFPDSLSKEENGSKCFSVAEIRTLLLPATPEEIRSEVDILLSDLVIRLKQLLFNSLICAYYVGFIPIQFTEVCSTCIVGYG